MDGIIILKTTHALAVTKSKYAGGRNDMQYIGTISRQMWSGRAIRIVLGAVDLHWAIVGRELGKGGFDHWQFAVDCAGELESYVKQNDIGWHVEKCIDWNKAVRYCRKDGRYFLCGNPPSSERMYRAYKCGKFRLNTIQSEILRSIRHQSDRTITVWIDRKGSSGKSTLGYLEEIGGRFLSVPRTEQSAVKLMDFIAMHYDGEKVICIDLPRDRELTPALCGVLEDTKDGNVKTSKYQGTKVFIRGVKVVVFTNNYIPSKAYKSLSADRWDIHVIKEEDNENPTR